MRKVRADWRIHFPDHWLDVRPLDFTEGSWSFEQPALWVFQVLFQCVEKGLEQQEGVQGSATVAGVSMGLAQTLLFSRAWRIEERNVLDNPSDFV